MKITIDLDLSQDSDKELSSFLAHQQALKSPIDLQIGEMKRKCTTSLVEMSSTVGTRLMTYSLKDEPKNSSLQTFLF